MRGASEGLKSGEERHLLSQALTWDLVPTGPFCCFENEGYTRLRLLAGPSWTGANANG